VRACDDFYLKIHPELISTLCKKFAWAGLKISPESVAEQTNENDKMRI
jgi:hypothetical protein